MIGVCALVALLAAVGERADAPPSSADYQPAPTQSGAFTSPILVSRPSAAAAERLYPPAARRRGISGYGTVGCSVTKAGLVQDCVVQDESPDGNGFGAAAAAYLENARVQPAVRNGVAVETILSLSVWFSPGQAGSHPAIVVGPPPPVGGAGAGRMITVPTSVLPGAVVGPSFVSKPSQVQFDQLYPVRAAQQGVGGKGQVSCEITASGRARDCLVKSESPAGYGFGRATITYLQESTFRPALQGGKPIGGARLTMTVTYFIGAPHAAPRAGPQDDPGAYRNAPPQRPLMPTDPQVSPEDQEPPH